MYEVLFYVGTALGILFLLLSVFLFFRNRVPAAIVYFSKMKGRRINRLPAIMALDTLPVYDDNSATQILGTKVESGQVQREEKEELKKRVDLKERWRQEDFPEEVTTLLDNADIYLKSDATTLLDEQEDIIDRDDVTNLLDDATMVLPGAGSEKRKARRKK